MCQPEQLEGHQLGQLPVAASHPGPLLPVLAGENPVGAGAAPGSSDHRPADQQAGGTVEGTSQRSRTCVLMYCVKPTLIKSEHGRELLKEISLEQALQSFKPERAE